MERFSEWVSVLQSEGRGGRRPLQSRDPCVLSTPLCGGQGKEGRPDGLHAETADDPECDAQTPDPMAHGTGSMCLTAQDSCCPQIKRGTIYFDLRQFDMQLEIAKRTLLAWEESVRIGQARLQQGMIKKLDVDQFEAERENAAARIAELKRHMIQKENELSATLEGPRRWLVSHHTYGAELISPRL